MGKRATPWSTRAGSGARAGSGSNHESKPDARRAEKYIQLPGDRGLPPASLADEDLSHMTNGFECLRSRREPNATVHDGLAHSVAVIMAARACREGKKLYWDGRTERILEHAPESGASGRRTGPGQR